MSLLSFFLWIHTTSIALSANVLDWRSYKAFKNLISVLCIIHSKFHVGTVYSSCTSGWGTSCSRRLWFLNSLHIVSFHSVLISCYIVIVSSCLMLHSLQVDKYIWSSSYVYRGTRWRSWLRHCATSRKVRFPLISLEFFIDLILLAALWPWGWLSL